MGNRLTDTCPLGAGARQGGRLSPLLSDAAPRLRSEQPGGTEIKGTQTAKEAMKLALADGTMAGTENPKEVPRKHTPLQLSEPVSECSKVSGHEADIKR